MKPIYIEKVVHYHPNGVIPNKKFEETLETTSQWIVEKVGIHERRYMEDYDGSFPVYEIAKRAFLKLLEAYNQNLGSIDLIISASTHDDLHYPNPGNLVSEEFAIIAPIIQMKTACTSVAYAIATARAYILSGAASRVLLLNGEPFTRFIDYGDRSSCILFGDAASAMIVSEFAGDFEVKDVEIGGKGLKIVDASRVSDTSHFSPSEFVSGRLSSGNAIFNRRRNSDRKFQQDGRQVMQFVLDNLPTSIGQFMKKNGLSGDMVKYFISHQSNLNMMRELFAKIDFTSTKHLHNIELFGNTSSSGWVTVLSQNQKEITKGENVLVSSFGAGMTWANVLLSKRT